MTLGRKTFERRSIAGLLSLFLAGMNCFNPALSADAPDEHLPPTSAEQTPAMGVQTELSQEQRIDRLTDRILLKELELEKLNTQFRLETSLVSPWRQRRMFLYAQANSWLTEVSLIRQMQLRYKLAREQRPRGSNNVQFDTDEDLPDGPPFFVGDFDGDGDDGDADDFFLFDQNIPVSEGGTGGNPALTNTIRRQSGKERGRLAAANETQLVGQCIGVAGSVFEVGLNVHNYFKIRRKGLTPGQYHKRVQSMHAELEQLLAERQKFCAEGGYSSKSPAVNAESRVIKDLVDLSLSEYLEYHAAAKRFWVLQNTAYFVDITKNMLGVTGNIISLTGNHKRRPRMQGGAGVFSVLSGVAVLLTPVVGRVTGNLSGLAARRLVSAELNDVAVKDLSVLSADRQALVNLIGKQNEQKNVPSGLNQRLSVYQSTESLLKDNERYRASQQKRAHETLVENVVFAGVVAPPRIANGITQIIGGWRAVPNHSLANKLYAAGATAYAAGTGFNIMETIRVQANFELNNYKQKKKGGTTKQQFAGRLKRLDDMIKHLPTTKGG